MALQPGDRLGAYEIVGLIGHGAMGEVYRARDTRLGRDVAVKVLPAAFTHDADRLARLEREARLIAQVNHPNICTLFDIVEGESAPFLIFELIEGETLQQRLLRGPMPVRDALRCAAGIAAALEAAHSKGIIHRDLKPSNITITAAGTIKVLDFGVATLARDAASKSGAPDLTLTLGGTKEGVLVGTVAYVSPEQAMGDRLDGRSDIWAFGCLLYEMLTAKRAFPGMAVADTLAAVMRGEPDWTALPAGTPPALRTLLRRCLEKDRGSEARPYCRCSPRNRRSADRTTRAHSGTSSLATCGGRSLEAASRAFDRCPGLRGWRYLRGGDRASRVRPADRRGTAGCCACDAVTPAAGSRDNAPAAPLRTESPSPSTPARRFISPPDGVRWARAIGRQCAEYHPFGVTGWPAARLQRTDRRREGALASIPYV